MQVCRAGHGLYAGLRPRATVGSQNLEVEMRDPPGRHVHGDWVERGVGA